MRLMPMVMSCALMATIAGQAGASMVGYWNCNGFDPAVSTTMFASQGNGTLNFADFGDGASVFGGTDLNAPAGTIAGDSLGLTGAANNGSFAQIDLSTVGMVDLTLSFAVRRSATGFGDNRVDALLGGVWTQVATFTGPTTTWAIVSVDLTAFNSLENGTASLRLVFNGATSGSGTARIDNVLVAGSAVPAPGAAALVGLAGLVGGRRRRSAE